jgi:uncharacterized membrane protein YbhN (UPF0104 family)
MPRPRRYQGPLAATVGIALVVAVACFVLAGHGAAFLAALGGVSWWTLVLAVGLHVVAVVARSEAWTVSVRAAGASVSRRCCYQVASLGFAANVLAPSLGTAVRIWTVRRMKPEAAPPASALVTAEVPVLATQALFCAAMSFAFIGRLGVPWWLPVLAVCATAGMLAALPRLARAHAHGFWRGLAALRTRGDRSRVAGCVAVTVVCETGRTVLLLHAAGLAASVLDATALRMGSGLLAVLPIGPGSGAGAAMLIFGAGGVGAAAAAGVLLTATGLVADLGFAAWGVADLTSRARLAAARRLSSVADVVAAVCCVGLVVGLLATNAP